MISTPPLLLFPDSAGCLQTNDRFGFLCPPGHICLPLIKENDSLFGSWAGKPQCWDAVAFSKIRKQVQEVDWKISPFSFKLCFMIERSCCHKRLSVCYVTLCVWVHVCLCETVRIRVGVCVCVCVHAHYVCVCVEELFWWVTWWAISSFLFFILFLSVYWTRVEQTIQIFFWSSILMLSFC